ncbi:hypothetical protein B9G39_26975 [Zooshikella ganghwensis]|uniref:Uncharacterized protein n=1 Tax=Zooshikella ganghwensis TaxID=202772 RepID=A0A4P9VF57_9GAMM|nr:hypothetical protein B9G39_27520 [Zooshikella ganghwensis]RDH41705.1 hypothetical protein B9G39_26975 [Zooshikella ganghwensis]
MSALDPVEEHKRDCHARWMLDNMPAEEIREWLKKQPAEFREDMRQRLNTEREKRRNRGDINPNSNHGPR